MEIIGNKKGASTIESVIIVPIIITIAVTFIILLVTGYIFYVDILNGLYDWLEDHTPVDVEGEFRLLTGHIDKTFYYDNTYPTTKDIQAIVEYLIYLEEEYISE